jgi:hypothetical protein
MAPVAPYCAGAQKKRLVLAAGALEYLIGPGMPVDLLMGRVAKIRGFFVGELVQDIKPSTIFHLID